MDDAVLQSQIASERKLEQLKTLQIGALSFGLLAAILGGILVLNISRSIERLRGIAEEISRGSVDKPVPPTGIGEVRALSESFERMRFSLNATMGILERSDERYGTDTEPASIL